MTPGIEDAIEQAARCSIKALQGATRSDWTTAHTVHALGDRISDRHDVHGA